MDKQKIEILVATKVWDPQEWVDSLSQFDTVSKVHVWPTEEDLSKVEALFVWKPLDQGVIERLPNLKWISSLGAGVDHLVGDAQIPYSIPITRIVDPFLARDMSNYVAMGVLMHQRNMGANQQNQNHSSWERLTYSNLKVGVMGLGKLGSHCVNLLRQMGFDMSGWSRTLKHIEGVKTYAQTELKPFLSELDVLVNLLPVTPDTESILNSNLFEQLPQGVYLINVARGNHLVEEDLIAALNNNHLSGALLDVFRQEPLPKENPLWTHPKVTITPHVASVTNPSSALELLKANIKRLIHEEELLHVIDREAGY